MTRSLLSIECRAIADFKSCNLKFINRKIKRLKGYISLGTGDLLVFRTEKCPISKNTYNKNKIIILELIIQIFIKLTLTNTIVPTSSLYNYFNNNTQDIFSFHVLKTFTNRHFIPNFNLLIAKRSHVQFYLTSVEPETFRSAEKLVLTNTELDYKKRRKKSFKENY